MWVETLVAASTNTALVPSALQYTYSSSNFLTAANKVAALNNTSIGNTICFGHILPLSHILPVQALGSTNTTMDAALIELLGAEYIRAGYIGQFMGVRLMPMQDAIVPGTQNSSPATVLPRNRIWLMASNAYKPLTICYNSESPLQIEIEPMQSANLEIGVNVTFAIDMVALVNSKIATISPV